MATYSKLANAIISLATASFDREGFGIPLFMSSHRYTQERVIAVTRDSYADELPANSPVFEAAKTAFAQPNGLSQLLIGRVEADAHIALQTAPVQNDNFKITIEVNDGDKIEIDYTETTASPTEEIVLNGIKSLIDVDDNVSAHVSTTVSGSGSAATLTLTTTTGDTDYFLSGLSSNLFESYTATETATEAYNAIKAENDTFYVVTCQDKTDAWLLELAGVVNADIKQFWTTVSDQSVLTAVANPATDILATLKENSYERVVAGYHQDAETSFPELGAVAYNLPFLAGTIVFGNDRTSGITASQTSDGKNLTITQKQYLLDRDAYFWDLQGGSTFLNSDVKTSSGERPENVRGRDNMVVDIQAGVSELLLNQVGGKIPYTNLGITQISSVIDTVLQTYVQRNFILPDYVISAPDARDILGGIKATQKLDNLTFVAQLAGAITMVDAIRGTLQLDEVIQ